MSFWSRLLRRQPRATVVPQDPTPPSAPEVPMYVPSTYAMSARVSSTYAMSARVYTGWRPPGATYAPTPSQAPLPEPTPPPTTFTKPLCGQETKRSILR